MNNNTKVIIQSVAATLLVSWLISNIWLLFILIWIVIGIRLCSFVPSHEEDIANCFILAFCFTIIIPIILEEDVRKGIAKDFNWLTSKILGGKTIKFRSPIYFENLPEGDRD